MNASGEDRRSRMRAGWLVLVAALAAIAYLGRLSGGKPPEDVVYRWSFSIGSVVQYGVVLGLVLLIARGAPGREVFGLRRPPSWLRAGGIALGVLIAIVVLNTALEPVLQAGEEQGLTPDGWNGDRWLPFAASFASIVVVAPVVEELTYRGLGFFVLRPLGEWPAILLVGLAFGLAHGLVGGLPLLAAFGVGLAFLRSRTTSIYPCIALHALFNAIALSASVLLAEEETALLLRRLL